MALAQPAESPWNLHPSVWIVCRILDLLDEQWIELVCELLEKASRTLFQERVLVVYADRIAHSLETAKEDGVYQKGFSRDTKQNESHVLLSLLVSREGLPNCCDVHTDKT